MQPCRPPSAARHWHAHMKQVHFAGGIEVWDRRTRGLQPTSRSPSAHGLTGCQDLDRLGVSALISILFSLSLFILAAVVGRIFASLTLHMVMYLPVEHMIISLAIDQLDRPKSSVLQATGELNHGTGMSSSWIHSIANLLSLSDGTSRSPNARDGCP